MKTWQKVAIVVACVFGFTLQAGVVYTFADDIQDIFEEDLDGDIQLEEDK